MNPRLFVFACFLNERAMLPSSLEQLDLLPAHEIHIADGCFDRRFAEHSTDGTFEMLQGFAAERNNVVLHQVVRATKVHNILSWIWFILFPPHPKKATFARIATKLFQTNNYRLNQAATFNQMLRQSSARNSDWIMTYDADEYFDDAAVAAFSSLHLFTDVVPIRERTFVGGLTREALRYPTTELRFWNVPHRVQPYMQFLPPRLIAWPVRRSLQKRSLRKPWPYRVASAPTSGPSPVGTLFHYKFFDAVRSEEAYRLGDRKPPDMHRLETTTVKAPHPDIPARAFAQFEGGSWHGD